LLCPLNDFGTVNVKFFGVNMGMSINQEIYNLFIYHLFIYYLPFRDSPGEPFGVRIIKKHFLYELFKQQTFQT